MHTRPLYKVWQWQSRFKPGCLKAGRRAAQDRQDRVMMRIRMRRKKMQAAASSCLAHLSLFSSNQPREHQHRHIPKKFIPFLRHGARVFPSFPISFLQIVLLFHFLSLFSLLWQNGRPLCFFPSLSLELSPFPLPFLFPTLHSYILPICKK